MKPSSFKPSDATSACSVDPDSRIAPQPETGSGLDSIMLRSAAAQLPPAKRGRSSNATFVSLNVCCGIDRTTALQRHAFTGRELRRLKEKIARRQEKKEAWGKQDVGPSVGTTSSKKARRQK